MYGVKSRSKHKRREYTEQTEVHGVLGALYRFDPWEEMLRWNRSRKTGLRYEELSAMTTVLEQPAAVLEITDLNVDPELAEKQARERKENLCRKALSRLL